MRLSSEDDRLIISCTLTRSRCYRQEYTKRYYIVVIKDVMLGFYISCHNLKSGKIPCKIWISRIFTSCQMLEKAPSETKNRL